MAARGYSGGIWRNVDMIEAVLYQFWYIAASLKNNLKA